MNKYFNKHLLLGGFLLLWASCANITAPTGGAKDVKPPILRKRSLPDSALNFQGGKITFEFNEFIQLKDVDKQVVVTPLLKTKPKITQTNKHISIYFPDSILLPNTTYNVRWGDAIQDLREGNIYKNFQFTFSTGSYFDSLFLKGSIVDAQTGVPDTASNILLFPSVLGDSAFYKKQPMYVQKAVNGFFEFRNLPNLDFYIYSLEESNNNYRYDSPNEKISFYNRLVNPHDTLLYVKLYSFKEDSKQPDTTQKKRLGLKNEVPKNITFSYTTNIDTAQKGKRTFDINNDIVVTFSDSISNFDISRIRLFQGDNFDATATIKQDSTHKKLFIKTEWQQDADYSLQLQKNFAHNFQGLQATPDTFRFKTKKESDYGYLQLGVDTNQTHLFMLYKDQNLLVSKQAKDTLLTFSLLNPGEYQLRVLFDENLNGRWDTGNLLLKKEPEIVLLISEKVSIKANWGNKLNLHTLGEGKRNISQLKNK